MSDETAEESPKKPLKLPGRPSWGLPLDRWVLSRRVYRKGKEVTGEVSKPGPDDDVTDILTNPEQPNQVMYAYCRKNPRTGKIVWTYADCWTTPVLSSDPQQEAKLMREAFRAARRR